MKYKIVSEFVLDNSKLLSNLSKDSFPDCPLDIVADEHYGVTKGDIVAALDLDFVYDYALPQFEVDRWQQELGVNIVPHFIWSMKDNDLYPISVIGRSLFEIIKHRREIKKVPDHKYVDITMRIQDEIAQQEEHCRRGTGSFACILALKRCLYGR